MLVEASTAAAVVMVTIFVSYNLDGSRLVKRALRATVVRARITPDVRDDEVPPLMLMLRAVKDCTVTGEPKLPPRSRKDTSY